MRSCRSDEENYLSDLFSAIEAHDIRAEEVHLPRTITKRLKKHIDKNCVWGANLIEHKKQIGIIRSGSVEIGLPFKKPYKRIDPRKFHDALDPQCPICKHYSMQEKRDPYIAEPICMKFLNELLLKLRKKHTNKNNTPNRTYWRHYGTVADLLSHIKRHRIPGNALILYQRIEDVYFKKHGWNKNSIKKKDELGEDDEYVVMWSPIKYKGDNNLYLTAHY